MAGNLEISLNRMIYPKADVTTFLKIAAEADVTKVELRNDLPGKDLIDGLTPEEFTSTAAGMGIEVLTINALQKFNLPGARREVTRQLDRLIDLALTIGCGAIVCCPNNDTADGRSDTEMLKDTVISLRAFRSRLEDHGMKAYVEPLGFPESSLNSVLTAQQALEESGADCYRIVYDTFHHYLGPDNGQEIADNLNVSLIGIVHSSGVPKDKMTSNLRDEHRGLIDPADGIGNLEQITRLASLGYEGAVSFEPFSPHLADLEKHELIAAIRNSMALLAEDPN